MKTNFEITQEINTLAKKHYQDMDLAFVWGCAQALLTTSQLDIILGILKDKEVSQWALCMHTPANHAGIQVSLFLMKITPA